jgi:hypothetical protein
MNHDDFDPSKLDKGIRRTVLCLREDGFDTCDSGDGSKAAWMEGALDVPHVFMRIDPAAIVVEAKHLLRTVEALFGDAVYTIEATYSPIDGVAILSLMGVGDKDLE